MKTSLKHLPSSKQEQLRAITALYQAESPADHVILFGSYARGDWVEDVVNGYISDYDILLVVKDEAQAVEGGAWSVLQEKAQQIAGRVRVSPILHDLKQINDDIRGGQYFYLDILKEGISLYDSRRSALAAPPKVLEPDKALERAKVHFGYWFKSASGFWVIATYTGDKGLLAEAAFLFHQAAERYFHAALLVLTAYKPKSHNLAELAGDAGKLHPVLAGAMPRAKGTEDERIFVLLKKAYIEARYSKSYRVTKAELEAFRALTRDLGRRVREVCVEAMERMTTAEAVGELPELPSPEDRGQVGSGPRVEDPVAFEAWLSVQRAQDVEQGEQRGELRGRVESLLAILEARGIAVDEASRAVIEACADAEEVKRWIVRAATAGSAEEVIAS